MTKNIFVQQALINKLFTEGRATWEGIHIHKDGHRIPVEISIQIFKLFGKPMVLSSVRDITKRKRLEEQVKDTHEMKIFGQLAAGVAHEVRNPLNAILAITEALFHDIGDNPEYLTYLEHIRDQVDRLSTLMKDLLEIGKPISYDSFQPQTVGRIVTSTIDLWGMIDLSKRHALRYISPPGAEKLYVKTEIARLQQVVLNLLQNASQNSPEGSEIVIHVLAPRGKTVNIDIIDRGTGIPPDNLKHVFDPFFYDKKGRERSGLKHRETLC